MQLHEICRDYRENNQLPVQSQISSWHQIWGKQPGEAANVLGWFLPRLSPVWDTQEARPELLFSHFSSWNLVFHFLEICETYALEASQFFLFLFFFSQREENCSPRRKKLSRKSTLLSKGPAWCSSAIPISHHFTVYFIGYKNGVMIRVPKPCLS